MKKLNPLFLAVILFSCTMPPQEAREPIKDSEVFNSPFNKVWAGIVSTIAEMSLPIQSIEKESGLITTQFITDKSGWEPVKNLAYNPTVLLGTWTGCRYTYSIFVNTLSENQTKVKVNTHIEGFESNVTKDWHVCQSKGILEDQFFNMLRSSLGIQPTLEETPASKTLAPVSSKKTTVTKIQGAYVLFLSNSRYTVGDRVAILRNSKKIGEVEVAKIQGNQIACKIVSQAGGKIQIGDEIE